MTLLFFLPNPCNMTFLFFFPKLGNMALLFFFQNPCNMTLLFILQNPSNMTFLLFLQKRTQYILYFSPVFLPNPFNENDVLFCSSYYLVLIIDSIFFSLVFRSIIYFLLTTSLSSQTSRKPFLSPRPFTWSN